MVRIAVYVAIAALFGAIYANVVSNPYASALLTIVAIVFAAIVVSVARCIIAFGGELKFLLARLGGWLRARRNKSINYRSAGGIELKRSHNLIAKISATGAGGSGAAHHTRD